MYDIRPLDPKVWRGYLLDFTYTSDFYYDIKLVGDINGFRVTFEKRPFEQTFINRNVTNDRLFQPYWDDIIAYGVVENGTLIGVAETCVESWSNRLRVTEMWVDVAHRRMGLGQSLMDAVKERAVREKRRAVILETQSCNAGAIAFYLSQGFTLIGFEACCYTNTDLARREVRMEMGYFPGKAQDQS